MHHSENPKFIMTSLSPIETQAMLKLCIMASYADGAKQDHERKQIRTLSDTFVSKEVNLADLYQDVLLRKPGVSEIASVLQTLESRQLAYEMAVCVCEADEVMQDAEMAFLQALRDHLSLPPEITQPINREATSLAVLPLSQDPTQADGAADADGMILRYAIVCGALELLPQTMATFAIVPMQTKMVYRLGKQHGVELDRKSIAEFMATVGLGLAGQVMEGFARKLAGGIGKKLAGKWGGKAGDTAGGMAMSFATTYAIGRLAKTYYGSKRSLNLETLKTQFTPLVAEGKTLALQYTDDMTAQSQKLKSEGLTSLLKSNV
jgi:uncharacterized protein (DUF697 family)